MLCSIISIRQRRGNSAADEEFQIFVRQTLGDQYTPTHLDLNCRPFIDSMKLLAHAADLCNFVTDAERSFIRVRLPKVAARRQHVVARIRFLGMRDMHPLWSIRTRIQKQQDSIVSEEHCGEWVSILWFLMYLIFHH